MFRRLSTKYALSVAFLLSIVMLTVLVLAGRVVYQRTSDLRVELADSFSSAQAVNDVEALRASGVYLSNRLFNPLYRADISSLNEEIAQIHQWLAPRSILILDSEGRLVTDGSHENPRYREQISLPAGLQPSEPIVQNRSDGATLFFVIGFGGTTQGFARVELSNARRLEALRKLQAEVDTSWNGFESAFIDTALASLGVIALVSVVLGWRLSRSLSRPLSAMGQAAQEFAAGKLDHQLPEWSDDELGELARSLNDMARDLDKTSRLLTRTQEIAGLGSWEWRRQSATLTLSRGVYRILGSEPGAFEPTVNKLAEFTGASDREHLFSIMEGRYECPKSREIQIMRPDGTRRCVLLQGEPVLDTSERVTGYLGIIQDITEQRRSERQLETLANYDSLTRLPNRNLFYDRLRHAIQQAERRKSVVALLFLDLDGFKAINDALGHDIGDQLLQLVAERLDSVLRDCDTLARMGGDEFTVIVENVRDKSDLREVARKLIDSLSCGFDIQGRELIISTSIGIAMYPQDAQSIDNLIKIADAAMYAAKDDGKGTFRYFTAELDRNARARLSMEQELRRAIDCQDFELQFQPQIGTRTGRLVAVEVLLRWRRDGRLEAPATFMSVLEDTGLVTRLTRWVLQETCR